MSVNEKFTDGSSLSLREVFEEHLASFLAHLESLSNPKFVPCLFHRVHNALTRFFCRCQLLNEKLTDQS